MKTKKIILTLYVSIIALSSVGLSFSIAWYANSTRLQVGGIKLSVDGNAEIKIATTENIDDAKEHLDNSDLKATTLFTPITSAYSDVWMATKSDKPVFYDDTLGNIDLDLKSINSGFYNQDLYLYSDNDVLVTIDPEETFFNANALFNNAYASEVYERVQRSTNPADDYLKTLTVSEIRDRLNKIVEAMRFSILVPEEDHYQYIIIDPHKNGEVYQGGLLDNDIDRYYDYDSSSMKEIIQGDVKNRELAVYDPAPADDTPYENPDREPNAFNAMHKAGVQRFNLQESLNNGMIIEKEKSYSLDEFDNRITAPLQIPVYRNKPNKINLSIYIEGWDLESVNYTMGATFNASLQFQIARGLI